MIFSLDIQRARKGDSFLLHYGTQEKPALALIDGGPGQVYKPHLKPRLEQIRKARKLNFNESLPIDLLLVSHIDDDHIKGLLELSHELVMAKDAMQPLPWKVKSIWHNTFDNIIDNSPDELLASVNHFYGPAALSGDPDTEGLEPDVAMILASIDQGVHFTGDINKLGIRINPQFSGQLVMNAGLKRPVDMGNDLKIRVIGPMKEELLNLQKDYDAWLKKNRVAQKVPSALASFTDESIPNLSSIVILTEVGDKRILFTGDARGDKVLEGLEQAGLLKPGGTMQVDILKMPHHGSDRNVDPVFFSRIIAGHYVFAGNGEHGNPELNTMQKLLDERGDGNYLIYFTYPIADIDTEREKDWVKEQGKEKIRKKKNAKIAVREDWSPDKHSLSAFFAKNPEFAKKVRVVDDNHSYVIDLLDQLGY